MLSQEDALIGLFIAADADLCKLAVELLLIGGQLPCFYPNIESSMS
jgi:hypothetical protein